MEGETKFFAVAIGVSCPDFFAGADKQHPAYISAGDLEPQQLQTLLHVVKTVDLDDALNQ